MAIRKRRKESFRRGGSQSPGPATLMGLLLRATILRRPDERTRFNAEVKRTGGIDSGAIVNAAFQVAVHRLFMSGSDLRRIAQFVADVRRAFGDDFPILEAEALIREELGEESATANIDRETELKAKTYTIVGVSDVSSWTQKEVDDLLIEAEAIATKNGFNPTLAAET